MPEREPSPKHHRPAEVFGLTRNETLFYRISDTRFQAILNDDTTIVHSVTLDVNNYGEYLFVTLSREREGKPYFITFYGLGFHEQREKWIIDEWYWYEQRSDNRHAQQTLSKAEANRVIQSRREVITADRQDTNPSDRAVLFGLLADLTDEDGALAELEDLESRGLLWEDEDDQHPF